MQLPFHMTFPTCGMELSKNGHKIAYFQLRCSSVSGNVGLSVCLSATSFIEVLCCWQCIYVVSIIVAQIIRSLCSHFLQFQLRQQLYRSQCRSVCRSVRNEFYRSVMLLVVYICCQQCIVQQYSSVQCILQQCLVVYSIVVQQQYSGIVYSIVVQQCLVVYSIVVQ